MIIYSRFFPLGRYSNAMAMWPIIVVKKGRTRFFTPAVERHERIHLEQQKELLVVGFYVLYVLFFAVMFLWQVLTRWSRSLSECWDVAYAQNPMEAEAYENQRDEDYLEKRKHFSWVRYFGIRTD